MATTTAVPSDLLIYFPSRNYYAISWRINPVFGEDITLMDCEVQIDTSSSFDSINLKSLVSTSPEVSNFQNGNFFKSFSIYRRDLFEDVTYYVKIRVNSTTYISGWSTVSTFTLDKNTWEPDTNLLKGLLPDDNVYCKEGITTSGKLVEAYAREIAELKKEITQVEKNVNYYKCQDEDLFDVLGVLLQIYRDTSRPFVEYKRELLEFWKAFLESGTEAGIKRIVKAILGQDPEFDYIRDRQGWVVWDKQGTLPPTVPTTPYFYNDMFETARENIPSEKLSVEHVVQNFDSSGYLSNSIAYCQSFKALDDGYVSSVSPFTCIAIDSPIHMDFIISDTLDIDDNGNPLGTIYSKITGSFVFLSNRENKITLTELLPIKKGETYYLHYKGDITYVNDIIVSENSTYSDGEWHVATINPFHFWNYTGSSTSFKIYITPEQIVPHYFVQSSITNYTELTDMTAQPNSRHGKALGVILKVYNPFNLVTRHTLIEYLINKIKPANVRIYVAYYIPNYFGGGSWGTGYYGSSDEFIKYIPND